MLVFLRKTAQMLFFLSTSLNNKSETKRCTNVGTTANFIGVTKLVVT